MRMKAIPAPVIGRFRGGQVAAVGGGATPLAQIAGLEIAVEDRIGRTEFLQVAGRETAAEGFFVVDGDVSLPASAVRGNFKRIAAY
jgi:hypothetical protein